MVNPMQGNIILTGIPRSGTNLICYLLNQLPNTAALTEPMDVNSMSRLKYPEKMIAEIVDFFSVQRQSLLANGNALSTATDGKILDNYFGNNIDTDGLRKCHALQQTVLINKSLKNDFRLIIKHPNAFTALMEMLIIHFPCYAVIRNPLSVLASWNTVDIPVYYGHAPVAESIDAKLATKLASQQDRYLRQISLLSWYYERYKENLPEINIIRYENVIASSGKCLDIISSEAGNLSQLLESKNNSSLYDITLINKLSTMLIDTNGAYWDFYSKKEVEQLLTGECSACQE